MKKFTRFLLDYICIIAAFVFPLAIAAIGRIVFGPPALWEYIAAGSILTVVTMVLVLDALDKDE